MARHLQARRSVKNGRQTVETERDRRGRFVAGGPGGPGRPSANPFARYQAELRAALLSEVTPADLRAVVRTILRVARAGILLAAELALKWTLGGPPAGARPGQARCP